MDRKLIWTTGLMLLGLASATFAQGLTDLVIRDDGGRAGSRRPASVRISSHGVRIEIEDGVAKTTVKQTFANPNAFILEGTYVFPIPEAASLTEFTMVMNGKVVRGEVLEKDKARDIYEGIVRRMRDPALLEYVGTRMFRARVFPIPARGDVEVSLTYVEQVEIEGGVAEYRYPLKTQSFSETPVDSIAVHATVKSSTPIKSVFSSSHDVLTEASKDNRFSVSFEGKQVVADRDFHLFYTLSEGEFGLHLMSEGSTREDGWFMMTLAPKQSYDDADVAPKDVVFVVDTSGSMQEDEKMAQARRALVHGLKRLNAKDRFNLVAFSTEARRYADQLIEATPAAVAEAVSWVEALKAAGGTNIHDALTEALTSLTSAERVGMVVFLTDGLPTIGETRVEGISEAIRTRNGTKARIFAFGVGYDVNTRLLDLLAEQSRGSRDYVTPSGNMELTLSSFFDKIAYPVLSDISVVIDGLETSQVYPKEMPDLFKGTEIVVFGRYQGGGMKAVRLKGRVGQKEKEYVFEGRFAETKTGRDFIPVLWAKRKVGYLYDAIRLKGFNAELKDEIVELGKKYAIATPYTSFLVTEDGAPQPTPATAGGAWRQRLDRRDNLDSTAPVEELERLLDSGDGQVRDQLGRVTGDADAARVQREKPAEALGSDPAASPSPSGGIRAGGAGTSPRPGITGGTGLPATSATPQAESGADAVLFSLLAKDLREAKAGKKSEGRDPAHRTTAMLISGRTFHLRYGVWVETGLEKLDEAARKRIRKIEAFSADYFALVHENRALAVLLARMPRVLLRVGEDVVWITEPVVVEEAGESK